MVAGTLTALQEDRTREVLRKLSELSPQKRETALTMCNFFIDGMNAQERLMGGGQPPVSRSLGRDAQDSA